MADIADLPGYFWGNSPNVNQQLRQRIAMQMMSQRQAFPKTIGEGLSAIGDSIGDIGVMRRLEQGALSQQAAARAAVAPPSAAASPGYAPPDDEAPAVSAISRAISPDAQPQAAI